MITDYIIMETQPLPMSEEMEFLLMCQKLAVMLMFVVFFGHGCFDNVSRVSQFLRQFLRVIAGKRKRDV